MSYGKHKIIYLLILTYKNYFYLLLNIVYYFGSENFKPVGKIFA